MRTLGDGIGRGCFFHPYRSEPHYMRGTGPRWRAKHKNDRGARSVCRQFPGTVSSGRLIVLIADGPKRSTPSAERTSGLTSRRAYSSYTLASHDGCFRRIGLRTGPAHPLVFDPSDRPGDSNGHTRSSAIPFKNGSATADQHGLRVEAMNKISLSPADASRRDVLLAAVATGLSAATFAQMTRQQDLLSSYLTHAEELRQ